MGEEGEAGQGGRGEGGVYEEGVVVADEGWGVLDGLLEERGGGREGVHTKGDYADGLEDADVDGPEW